MRQFQQNDHSFNFSHRYNDSQVQTGNAYSMAQNYGPGPQDFQFGPMRGVPQQLAFMNHRPPLQMDYLPGPSWHQGQQYDTQRMYPHMPPPNYYLHTTHTGEHIIMGIHNGRHHLDTAHHIPSCWQVVKLQRCCMAQIGITFLAFAVDPCTKMSLVFLYP